MNKLAVLLLLGTFAYFGFGIWTAFAEGRFPASGRVPVVIVTDEALAAPFYW
jgi:hypothetical protein